MSNHWHVVVSLQEDRVWKARKFDRMNRMDMICVRDILLIM